MESPFVLDLLASAGRQAVWTVALGFIFTMAGAMLGAAVVGAFQSAMFTAVRTAVRWIASDLVFLVAVTFRLLRLAILVGLPLVWWYMPDVLRNECWNSPHWRTVHNTLRAGETQARQSAEWIYRLVTETYANTTA